MTTTGEKNEYFELNCLCVLVTGSFPGKVGKGK